METGGENVNIVIYRMLCFVKNALERIASYTFISHTKMSIVFRNGSVHELNHALKLGKQAKSTLVLARYEFKHVETNTSNVEKNQES